MGDPLRRQDSGAANAAATAGMDTRHGRIAAAKTPWRNFAAGVTTGALAKDR